VLEGGTPLKSTQSSQKQELLQYVAALEGGKASLRTLQKLVLICNQNPSVGESLASASTQTSFGSPLSPTPLRSIERQGPRPDDVWEDGRIVDRLFVALSTFVLSETVRD
jgi:CLIP-associating protein 1/2